jgi:lipase (class 3)
MDKTLATLLGKISRYIYAPSDADLPGLGGPKATLIHDKQSPPTSFAGVLRYPDRTVLVFQGTITAPSIQSVKDWLQNFRAAALRELGLPGLVHAGFAGQLKLICDDILKELARGFTPPLYVTGHSQGGAVAALATKALQLAGINVTATYTFAAPRPGDATFASSVETPVFRLEFGDDIVPHVPFRGVSLGPLEKAAAAFPELQQVLANAGIRDTLGYVSVGVLTYGAPEKPLRPDVSPATEQVLFAERAAHLLLGRQNLFLHHLMPNYIAMVG